MKLVQQAFGIVLAFIFFFSLVNIEVVAQNNLPSLVEEIEMEPATSSADASQSASASQAASLIIQERKDSDITETGGRQKDELALLLENNPVNEPTPLNFLARSIRNAVDKGVPANTLVLLLIFPLVSFFIAFSRHIVGLRGFGVYTPAVLAVAFVSTGIINGIILFLVVVIVTMITRKVIRPLKLQYLPRAAMLMWAVSLGILAFLLIAGSLGASALYGMSIFVILIIMLLSENFMDTQLASSQSEAIRLTVETILLATVSSFLIGSKTVQEMVILNPELTLVVVAILNFVVGKYRGLRALEYLRFRSIIER